MNAKSLEQYHKAKSGKLPEIDVSEEDFVHLMIESGQSEEDAKFQLTIAKALGARCMIGERMVGIASPKKKKKGHAK
jgi:hypothetical protein